MFKVLYSALHNCSLTSLKKTNHFNRWCGGLDSVQSYWVSPQKALFKDTWGLWIKLYLQSILLSKVSSYSFQDTETWQFWFLLCLHRYLLFVYNIISNTCHLQMSLTLSPLNKCNYRMILGSATVFSLDTFILALNSDPLPPSSPDTLCPHCIMRDRTTWLNNKNFKKFVGGWAGKENRKNLDKFSRLN